MNLKINGNTDIETQIIDSINYSRTHKNFSSIKTEVESIQHLLYKKGFIENQLINIKPINDSTFKGSFNLKDKYNFINIYYDKTTISNQTLELITKNVNENVNENENENENYFKLKFSNIENILNTINKKTSENGFPFSKLKLSNILIDNKKKLTAHLIIDKSQQKRKLSNIIIKGYENFPKSYLKHYLKIKPKQEFDLNKIRNRTKQLQNLQFANEIKSPEVLFSKDSTTLYLYLEKKLSNSFDGFLGFGTNEETSKIEFDGYLNLSLTNNLNFGESFKLLYKSDENEQRTFQTNLTLPYLLKSPIGIDLSLKIFKKDSTFSTVNQSAKIHYQINPKHKISAGILNEQSSNLLNKNTSTTVFDYTKNYFSAAYEFIKPQTNNLFPINSSLYLETNFGNRKESNNKESQTFLSVNASKIFNLNNKNSIFIRVNGASIDTDSYFENELLRFGGINSIRGFEENSLFASSYGLINTEYRFQLNNAIYLHSVIDVAHFENRIINTSENIFGFGLGFGILTKSGLFKLNFANGKGEKQPFKLSNSKAHISLTTIF